MQTSSYAGSNVIVLPPRHMTSPSDGLSPAAMARYLREIRPMDARCFALEMQERAAWANESWGAYWGDVADLV